MKLSEKKGGDFEPHPETESPVRAVIVDITPLKTRQTQYGEKEEFRLVFETEELNEEGNRWCLWSRGYTPSLNEKAAFRKDLKKMMGRALTAAELEEFDTESLIGMGVKVMVEHAHSEDGTKTYANIPLFQPDKTPLKPSGKYVRNRDREQKPVGGDGQASYRNAPKAAASEGRADWQKCKVHIGKHAGVDLGDLDEEAVTALIEKWLPKHKETAKPKADDKRLAAALDEVGKLIGLIDEEPAVEEAAVEEEY